MARISKLWKPLKTGNAGKRFVTDNKDAINAVIDKFMKSTDKYTKRHSQVLGDIGATTSDRVARAATRGLEELGEASPDTPQSMQIFRHNGRRQLLATLWDGNALTRKNAKNTKPKHPQAKRSHRKRRRNTGE